MSSIVNNLNKKSLEELSSTSISGNSTKTLNVNNRVEIKKDSSIPNNIGGSVDIKKISIRMHTGISINIKGYFTDLLIEESIFASSISGKITITDTAGGLEKFVIHGGERLILKIHKPNIDDIIIWREDLIITKISKSEVSQSNLTKKFDLFFTSNSAVKSLKKNLFKSYKNNSVIQTVHSIYKEMSVNDIVIEDPGLTLNKPFTVTGLSPHKAIDRLAQRSCSKGKYFVFFERFVPVFGNYPEGKPFTASHYFGSVEKLIRDSEQGQIKTIIFSPKLSALAESSTIRASSFEILENFNHLNGMRLGFYNSTIYSINPIDRTHKVQKISYTKGSSETQNFYSNKLLSTLNPFNIYDDKKNETPGRKVILSSINDPIDRSDWLKYHVYGQLSNSMFKILVTIQGATNTIGIGNVVNFATPSQVSITTNAKSPYPELDQMHSGRYLVTSVIHSISSSKYIKSMQLSRGSSPLNYDKHTEYDASFDDIKQLIRKEIGNR
jgi:hypothetical protein